MKQRVAAFGVLAAGALIGLGLLRQDALRSRPNLTFWNFSISLGDGPSAKLL